MNIQKDEKVVCDLERLEEKTLAMAQAEIQDAMSQSGIARSKLAMNLGKPKSFVTRILSGNHNLTIRTMARVFGACGFEVRFNRADISSTAIVWNVSDVQNVVDVQSVVDELCSRRPGDAPRYAIAKMAYLGSFPGHPTLAS